MMNPYEQGQAFGGVIDVLEAIDAQYAIWGGLAVVAYGEPRFTQDMDVLLSPHGLRVPQFVRTLKKVHYHVNETAVQQAMNGGFFNVIHMGYHIKTDFYVPTQPHLAEMIKNRVYLPFDEIRKAAYVSVTAVILAKLEAYRDSQSTRHLDDVASIIRLQGPKIERKHIEIHSARLGLLGVWRALIEQNKP